ncbi:MAG: DUF2971 domain-containing protein [Bacteroidales bacterium]|nr:DUF2971 domain-containing protein [Bacteroidales bacterium]
MTGIITTEYVDGTDFSTPKVLFKYRDWDNHFHKSILLENRIYLSPPRDFEDKMDCNLPEEFPSKNELYDIFLGKSKKKNPTGTRQTHRAFARYWSKKSPLANRQELNRLISEFNDEFNERFGILSVTADCSNEDMWKKYGNDSQGICIGFDTEKLFGVVGGGGEVVYEDKLPVIDFINDDFKTKHVKNIFFKEKSWEYEKEYRLHKFWKDNPSSEDRNIAMPEGCILKVILGKNISEENKNEITKIMNEKYPKAEITNMPNG